MKPLVKVPVVNGLIAGVLGAVLNIILYYLGRHPYLIPVYFDYRILLLSIFLFFTLKEFRDNYQNGALYFWQGLIGSFIFTTAFAAIASLVLWIFGVIEPDFVREYITKTIEMLKGWPQQEIDRIGKELFESNLQRLPATNSSELALHYFAQCYVLGFFISIIMSVLLRKQPNL